MKARRVFIDDKLEKLRDKKKYIIDTTDMRDVLSRYGVKIRGDRVKCPITDHGRGDPSAKVFKDGVKCWTCNKTYNVFDIVMKYEHCDFATAFNILGGNIEMTDERKVRIEEAKRLRNLELQKEKDYWLELYHLANTIKFCEKMLKENKLEFYHLWQLSCWRWDELFKREKEK